MQTQPRTKPVNPLFADEATEKRNAITCLLDYYKQQGTILNEFDLICELQALDLSDLSQLLGDIIIHLEVEVARKFRFM